jgi:hypothetical protein
MLPKPLLTSLFQREESPTKGRILPLKKVDEAGFDNVSKN